MRVAIIDYTGSGNLRSATKAFQRAARDLWHLGWRFVLTDKG